MTYMWGISVLSMPLWVWYNIDRCRLFHIAVEEHFAYMELRR